MQANRRAAHVGIDVRHARDCASRHSDRCSCRPSYQAHVWSARDRKRVRKTFRTVTEAKAWRRDMQTGLARGTVKAPSKVTVREAAEAWLAGAQDGSIRNRSGDRYKPSVVRSYETSLRLHVLPNIGYLRLGDLTRNAVQDLADRMMARGADPSTVRNAVMPLRVIYRRAVNRGDVAVSPTDRLELPAVRGRRSRVACPAEAARLIAALPEPDRALWGTALYAGLRLGELRALDWSEVDLASGIIRVQHGWDPQLGCIAPKSRSSVRNVPLVSALRELLIAHRLRQGRRAGLVFARDDGSSFNPSSVNRRAQRCWKRADETPITLHECRHTFASLMIAAGVNAKALATYMGHANISVTFDRYGHLMPGSESAAADLLDRYLQSDRARVRSG